MPDVIGIYFKFNSGDLTSTSSQMWQLELANVSVKGWVINSDKDCFFDVYGNAVVLHAHYAKVIQEHHDLWCSDGLWWGIVLSYVPWIFLQKFCLTLQCTHLHIPPFHICTYRSPHFSAVWCPFLLGVPGDLWWCCLLWNIPLLHVSMLRSAMVTPLNPPINKGSITARTKNKIWFHNIKNLKQNKVL